MPVGMWVRTSVPADNNRARNAFDFSNSRCCSQCLRARTAPEHASAGPGGSHFACSRTQEPVASSYGGSPLARAAAARTGGACKHLQAAAACCAAAARGGAEGSPLPTGTRAVHAQQDSAVQPRSGVRLPLALCACRPVGHAAAQRARCASPFAPLFALPPCSLVRSPPPPSSRTQGVGGTGRRVRAAAYGLRIPLNRPARSLPRSASRSGTTRSRTRRSRCA